MRGAILILSIVLPWPSALAAPWIQEEGGLYTRIALAAEEVEGLSAWRGDVYGEYGVSDKWTLTAKLEGVAFEDSASDFNRQGWRATGRRQLFQYKGWLGSVEIGALQGEAIGGANGCETLGAEARAGVAWSGAWQKTETFTFAEVAGRFHDGCRRERFEYGLGQRLTRNVWSVSQVWIERGNRNARSDKLQTEFLWKAKSFEASIGYRQEMGGQFEEESIFVSFAKKY